jgi:hypothetical protein
MTSITFIDTSSLPRHAEGEVTEISAQACAVPSWCMAVCGG